MKRLVPICLLMAAILACMVSAQAPMPTPTKQQTSGRVGGCGCGPLCNCGPDCQCPPGGCPNCPGCTIKQVVGKISLGGQVSPDGKCEVSIDLPVDVRMRNIGSKIDRAGMCVTTASEHGCYWHNIRDYYGFRNWAAQYPGGSWPEKHDKQIKQYAQVKGVPVPPYIQYEGKDPAIIMEALRAGLCVSSTYAGRDGVRYSGVIGHFVNPVYLSKETGWAAVMDNNGKAEDLIWMSFDEFVDRWTNFGRSGWVFLWLVPPPPPPCCN